MTENPSLTFDEYRRLVASIPIGKRLPDAVYVHADGLAELPGDLIAFLLQIQARVAESDLVFNVLKFHRASFKISLLSYPDFFANPHPPLVAAPTIDLARMVATKRSYSGDSNRPVLHRKEEFLPSNHPRREEFRALTKAEQGCGLFDSKTSIGFERQWQALLESKGVSIQGHRLVCSTEKGVGKTAFTKADPQGARCVLRHKTAISRFGLSRPVQCLLKSGILDKHHHVFDYGCGRGDDIRALQKMGFQVTGWDPEYLPDGERSPADIVNLGFVINVIEEPFEREAVLREAFALAKHVLVVSAQLDRSGTAADGEPYRDGVLTPRGTFQRYYQHEELGRLIEGVLNTTAVSAGPGIYLVFKDPAAAQGFLQGRNARMFDFAALSRQLFGDKPRRTTSSPRRASRTYFEEHHELLDEYWSAMVQAGRPLGPGEFERFAELADIGLTERKAKNLFTRLFGEGALDEAFLGKNRELVEAFWDRMVFLGRLPAASEFERSAELAERGITGEQLKNLYLHRHGPGSLERRFRERHRDLIEDFWKAMVRFGRVPRLEEYDRAAELGRLGLAPQTLHTWFLEEFGAEVFERAVMARRDDLVVYLALANFRRSVPFSDLPAALRVDLRTFFGSYQRAKAAGRELLFSLGAPGTIEEACEIFGEGHSDERGLVFHCSLRDLLPASLRVLMGCAGVLEGGIEGADIIKIHTRSRKVTLWYYEDFARRSFPVLKARVKIDLAAQESRYFDYSEGNQVLLNKHLYVSVDHPRRSTWEQFHRRVTRMLGEFECAHVAVDALSSRLAECGYDMRLRRL